MSSRLQRIIKKTQELLHIEKEPEPKPKHEHVVTVKHPEVKVPSKPRSQEGIDYSYGSGLTADEIRKHGKTFVCRYISGGDSKDLNKKEAQNLLKAGLAIVLVWETTANRMLAGKQAGTEDGEKALKQANALGLTAIPIYFAADFDATEAQQTPINRYLSGAALALGSKRVGIYGGYWAVKRAFDAQKCAYGWQTYAWSGGKWDSRAHLHQYQNGAQIGPAEVDLDQSMAVDFGQYPRP